MYNTSGDVADNRVGRVSRHETIKRSAGPEVRARTVDLSPENFVSTRTARRTTIVGADAALFTRPRRTRGRRGAGSTDGRPIDVAASRPISSRAPSPGRRFYTVRKLAVRRFDAFIKRTRVRPRRTRHERTRILRRIVLYRVVTIRRAYNVRCGAPSGFTALNIPGRTLITITNYTRRSCHICGVTKRHGDKQKKKIKNKTKQVKKKKKLRNNTRTAVRTLKLKIRPIPLELWRYF